MANERSIAMDSKKEIRSLSGKTGSFKPSAPTGYVRPKPVPVPQKSK